MFCGMPDPQSEPYMCLPGIEVHTLARLSWVRRVFCPPPACPFVVEFLRAHWAARRAP